MRFAFMPFRSADASSLLGLRSGPAFAAVESIVHDT
jgi:hypothetical protein